MWNVSSELHQASLRSMRRLMHCLLLLPPCPHLHLKLLYTFALLIYLIFILYWRFSFNYNVVYNFRNDNFLRNTNLFTFWTLTISHCVVGMELIWRNRSERIEQQLEQMRYVLRVQFGHKVNLVRIRRYCHSLLLVLEVCCVSMLGMAIYNNLMTDIAVLVLYAFYSEMVLLMRFTEFTLYSALILVFYMELNEVGFRLIMELDKTQFEVKSVRRLSLERLLILQQLHGQLWKTVRSIEGNFELSLVTLMLKFFMDTHILPFWIYANLYNNISFVTVCYCITEELCKLSAFILPCLICTHCDRLQRQLRSIFHGLTTDRCNEQLNFYLYRISLQLGQERCQFSAGGFLVVNNEILGRFVFGMISYIIVCIQFRISLIDKRPVDAIENSVTDVQFTEFA